MIRRAIWPVISSPLPWAIAAVVFAVRWGRGLQHSAPEIFLGAAPFVGRNFRDGWDWRWNWALIAAATLGVIVVVSVARGWWWKVGLRTAVAASGVGSGVFATLLALTDRTDGLLRGATDKTEYLANVRLTPPVTELLSTFVDRIGRYSVHVRGHPPGFVLVLKVFDETGLGGPWPVVALSIAATIAVPVAVLTAARTVAGPEWVRRLAPLLLTAPYVLWMVTSADAVFTAVAAWSVAVLLIGTRSTVPLRALAWGVLSGLLFGVLLFLTYGGAMFAIVTGLAVIAAIRTRQSGWRMVVVGWTLGAAAVTAAFAIAGFWWFAGAAATRREYWAGTAQFRTWSYFVVANLAVMAVIVGPATLVGLRRLCSRPAGTDQIGVLALGGTAALIAAHLSQYSRGEVERIWLLFFPWMLVAAGVWMSRTRRWTAALTVSAHVVVAVVLQAVLVSKW